MGYFSTDEPRKLPSVEALIGIAKRQFKAKNMVDFAQTRTRVQEKLDAVRSENTSRFGTSRMTSHDNVIAKCETLLEQMDAEIAKAPPEEDTD